MASCSKEEKIVATENIKGFNFAENPIILNSKPSLQGHLYWKEDFNVCVLGIENRDLFIYVENFVRQLNYLLNGRKVKFSNYEKSEGNGICSFVIIGIPSLENRSYESENWFLNLGNKLNNSFGFSENWSNFVFSKRKYGPPIKMTFHSRNANFSYTDGEIYMHGPIPITASIFFVDLSKISDRDYMRYVGINMIIGLGISKFQSILGVEKYEGPDYVPGERVFGKIEEDLISSYYRFCDDSERWKK